MPIVQYGDRRTYIPFDAGEIANHLYNGADVFPDEGTSAARVQVEMEAVQRHIKKLWKKQPFRTVPDRVDRNNGPFSMPDSGSDQLWGNVSEEDFRENYRKVMPNPTINYQIRDVGTVPVTRSEAALEWKKWRLLG